MITVEEAKTSETEVDFVEGMQFDRGYLFPLFRDKSADRDASRLEDAYILLHEKKSPTCSDLPCWKQTSQSGKPLLIVAEDVEGEALTALVVTSCVAVLNLRLSRPPALAIAARPCSRTSPR